jgi:hypothetical protein
MYIFKIGILNLYSEDNVLTNTQKFKFPAEFQSRQTNLKHSKLFILTFQNLENFGMLHTSTGGFLLLRTPEKIRIQLE